MSVTRSRSSTSRRDSESDYSPALRALPGFGPAASHTASLGAAHGAPHGKSGSVLRGDSSNEILSVAHFSFTGSSGAGSGAGTGSSRGSFSGGVPHHSTQGTHGKDVERDRLLSHGPGLTHLSASDEAAEAAALQRDIILLGGVFVVAVVVVAVLYTTMPHLPPDDAAAVRLPRSMEQLRALLDVAVRYKGEHFAYVTALFSAVYIFLQMFAIPGAVFLSILAGPLFGLVPGMFLISTVATTGTSVCYLLSNTFGRRLVRARFPDLLKSLQTRIDAHRDSLLFYMFFLRVTPLLPNWFINIASPIVAIPLKVFVPATFIGLMPGNYIHLSTGLALNSVAADKPLMTPGAVVFLFLVGAIALLPVLFKSRLEAYDRRAIASSHGAGAAPMVTGFTGTAENSHKV